MNTLQLQMEVTRFLHRCESARTSQITTLPLPTLFGNNHMKMEVACQVRRVCHLWQTAHVSQDAYSRCNYLTVSVVSWTASSILESKPQARGRVQFGHLCLSYLDA